MNNSICTLFDNILIDIHFKSLHFKEHSSKKLPPLTAAGDYFINGITCEDAEIVNVND